MDQLSYKKFSELKMESPDIISFGDAVRITIPSKQVLRRVTHGIGMPNVSFSKNLYILNPTMWSQLVTQTMRSESSIEFLSTKTAIIDSNSNELIGVTDSVNVSELFDYTKSLSDKLGFEYLSEYFDQAFSIKLQSDSCGLWIVYYPDNDWLEVKNYAYLQDSSLFINPYSLVSCEVADSNFETLLDSDVLASNLDNETFMKYHAIPFTEKLNDVEVSIAEIKRLLKYDLDIKYTEDSSAFDIAADRDDFNAVAVSMLTNIFGSLEKHQRVALYSSDLKREITFSTPARDYYVLLSALSSTNVRYWRSLSNFIESILGAHLNYIQLQNDAIITEEE